MNSFLDDFEIPSFSLGLEGPSFSLGIGDSQPPTPFIEQRSASEQVLNNNQQAAASLPEDSDSEDMPRRPLKRLRRGSKRNTADTPPVSSSSAPVFASDPVDDIEEFSSDDGHATLQFRTNSKSFSSLKPVSTPPVIDKRGPGPSPVSITKTSLGCKEVKFQEANCRTPVYDERVCIDVDEDNDQARSVADNPGQSDQVTALLRERLPYFSFIDDLEVGAEPVYIDYRGQFGKQPAGRNDMAKTPKVKPGGKGRAKTKSGAASSENSQQCSTDGRKGHWLTEFGIKVYVTADGRRLSGQTGYKQYMKDNGKLSHRSHKKKQRTRKQSQR